MHLKDFWIVSRFDAQGGITETKTLYHFMVEVFANPVPVTLYVLGCISLAYHLLHGFQSAFKTIGVHNKRYHVLISSIGYGFAIIIPLVFALMPISFYLHWVN